MSSSALVTIKTRTYQNIKTGVSDSNKERQQTAEVRLQSITSAYIVQPFTRRFRSSVTRLVWVEQSSFLNFPNEGAQGLTALSAVGKFPTVLWTDLLNKTAL
jgi:hypothetical protein